MSETASQPFVDPQEQFTLQAPPGWLVDTSGIQRTRVILFHPLMDRAFRANVTVVVEPVRGLTREDYLLLCRLQLKQLLNGATLSFDGPAEQPIGGHWFEYSISGPALPLAVRQLICVVGGKAYVVSATAPADIFQVYRQQFETILASFRMLPKAEG
jgi:hypothetical protein